MQLRDHIAIVIEFPLVGRSLLINAYRLIVACRCLSLLIVAYRRLSLRVVACRCLSLLIVAYRCLSLIIVACRCMSCLVVAYLCYYDIMMVGSYDTIIL